MERGVARPEGQRLGECHARAGAVPGEAMADADAVSGESRGRGVEQAVRHPAEVAERPGVEVPGRRAALATTAALEILRERAHGGGRVRGWPPRAERARVDFAFARGPERAADPTDAMQDLAGRVAIERGSPQADRHLEAPARHAQVVDGLGILRTRGAAFRRANAGGRGEDGVREPAKIACDARGSRHTYGATACCSRSATLAASMADTRSARNAALSSTGRVASSVSNPYSVDSVSSSSITRRW